MNIWATSFHFKFSLMVHLAFTNGPLNNISLKNISTLLKMSSNNKWIGVQQITLFLVAQVFLILLHLISDYSIYL